MKNKIKRKLKAYSIIELIISMAIIAIATGVLLSSLIYGFRLNVNAIARTFVREEISNVVSLIGRELRNADRIILCAGDYRKEANQDISNAGLCMYAKEGIIYQWSICEIEPGIISICQYRVDATLATLSLAYQISSNVNIDRLIFESDVNNNSKDGNILITIIGSHSNSNLSITNVFSQISATTRNFEI